MITIPDEGKRFLLDFLLRPIVGTPLPWLLKLWRNDVDITDATVRGDLTEANYAGYLPVELTRAEWSESQMSDGYAQSRWQQELVEWIASAGSQTVYGVFVADPDDNFVLWGERLPAPFTITTTLPLFSVVAMRLTDIPLP